ncbi:MAG: hypothetical protein M3Y69_10065 [Verrucomicrobiota bacterium]|nr:hypothetical protein [Verrucomicrobiota bacterium]
MRILYFLIGALPIAFLSHAATADEEKPHGRVCFSVVESGPPAKEEPFRISTPPGAGKQLKAHIDASNKCTVLVAALSKDGKLVNGWRPQISQVPDEFEEVELPIAPVTWDWSAASTPFDFYVLFLPSGSKEREDITKLVAAMQAPKTDERLLGMQAAKLRELIGRITNAKEKVNQAAITEPEVGGVFRGGAAAFPWRQFAQSIDFSDDRPGVLILSSESAPKGSPTP